MRVVRRRHLADVPQGTPTRRGFTQRGFAALTVSTTEPKLLT